MRSGSSRCVHQGKGRDTTTAIVRPMAAAGPTDCQLDLASKVDHTSSRTAFAGVIQRMNSTSHEYATVSR